MPTDTAQERPLITIRSISCPREEPAGARETFALFMGIDY